MRLAAIPLFLAISILHAYGQSISSGTVQGTVTDPSGALIVGAQARLANPVTGFQQTATTDTSGTYRFTNVPFNEYQLSVTMSGFAPANEHVDVHNTLPITQNVSLKLASEATSVTVEAAGAQVETDTSTHQDVDRSTFLKLPTFDPAGGLNQAIAYSTGGVAADANGFFHPVGDHAQVSFVIDGQPISDQQSKLFSTQLPASAIESMEVVTGTPSAEFGDKTSRVANITTRSGLGSGRAFGSVDT